MATIIVAFESRYGQTNKIAEYIADRARREGHDARLVRASLATHATLDTADGFVVVAPVYFGRHPDAIKRFLRTYGGTLGARPLAFVSVSNSAAHPAANAQTTAKRLAQRTVDEAALRARAVVSVAGALAYPRYGFFLRQVMRLVAKSSGTPTDTRRIHELTDWEALDVDLASFFGASDFVRRGDRTNTHPAPGAVVQTLA